MAIIAMTEKKFHVDEDVSAYFGPQTPFGTSKVLGIHLPPYEQQVVYAKNMMTIDFLIGALILRERPDITAQIGERPYLDWIAKYANNTIAATRAFKLQNPRDLLEHFQMLQQFSLERLVEEAEKAFREQGETITIFTPEQCNMRCVGCYTNATFLNNNPFTKVNVDSYLEAFARILSQAKQMGFRNSYTSGLGEPLSYPRFFEMLQHVEDIGMQALFFTNGLPLASEAEARETIRGINTFAARDISSRINERVHYHLFPGYKTAAITALANTLVDYRNNIHIYHSVWAFSQEKNDAVRKPRHAPLYVNVNVRRSVLTIPLSLYILMNYVFTEERRSRLGLEVPISNISIDDMGLVATFVADNGLRSYFEPVLVTGRNRGEGLMPADPKLLEELKPFMVRGECGWRYIFQPTIQPYWGEIGKPQMVITPGMSISAKEQLSKIDVLDDLTLTGNEDSLFSAMHHPIIAFENYSVGICGCKCEAFNPAEAKKSYDRILNRDSDGKIDDIFSRVLSKVYHILQKQQTI